MAQKMRFRVKYLFGAAALTLLLYVVIRLIFISPSNDREWKTEHAVMPSAEFSGTLVHVKNIRNFSYRSGGEFTPAYQDRIFDLEKIESVWFVLSPFVPGWRGPAHGFLSFGFADSQFVSISVEARKEPGESYSILKGLVNTYELIYVIGDERDLVGLRAVYWDDPVYVFPIKTGKERIRALFVDMLERANKLRESPEFYNTLTSNCTTNLYEHANKLNPGKWSSFSWKLILPGYADELIYEKGVLDTELTLLEARERFKVNERAKKFIDSPNFSLDIRQVNTLSRSSYRK
ncbi:MAG: DUF4105 domain-containing protein [Proteobacteria bacterium]|nr:DUF4105 domain-containing protein [Pseudomonadota bacterium]